ncbi:hypothetical protein P3342_010574 [Pyrenophora teres f. teres]|nr:hypothetical protein P3342_010574 [Pyrenophora teres f. teres]
MDNPSVMSQTRPTVLCPLTLTGLLHHLLTNQSYTCPTLLIICSSRDVFLQDLATSLQQHHSEQDPDSMERLIAPTLHNLLTMRHIQLVFCTSVQALLAYLTAYGRPGAPGVVGDTLGKEKIVLVNPLTLHASTPSFSAQGLSRCFATVAETALRVVAAARKTQTLDMEKTQAEADDEDPWEQEVSIMNVSARRFGSGPGEIWFEESSKVVSLPHTWRCANTSRPWVKYNTLS